MTSHRVGCHLSFRVTEPATVVLQVAPAETSSVAVESLVDVAVDGRPVEVEVLQGPEGGRSHLFDSPVGHLHVACDATVTRVSEQEAPVSVGLDLDQLTHLRQSRYCPSDRLSGFAAYELGHLAPGPELLAAVGTWVASRLTYTSGSSGPLDSAVESLFAGKGVCRDFAHLAITVLRALEVPARLVSAYAPGLSPMDFHAVVEAHVAGSWCILDATRLAPRQSLVRIATGRDAADTAFVTVLGGDAELLSAGVSAVVDGDLPVDDHTGVVALPA